LKKSDRIVILFIENDYQQASGGVMKLKENLIEDIYFGMQLFLMIILLNIGFPLFSRQGDLSMRLFAILYVCFMVYRFMVVFIIDTTQKGWLGWQHEVISGLIEGLFLSVFVLIKINTEGVLSNVIFAYILIQTIRSPGKAKYLYLLIGLSLEGLIYYKSARLSADLVELFWDVALISFITFSMSLVFKELFRLQAENTYAIHKLKESNDKLGLLASTDYLTGLYNYKAFHQKINEYGYLYEKTDSVFCMAIIDVDDFKIVNDTFGHPAGDMILAGVAAIIAENMRGTDFAARYGGEEFAIIFPDVTLTQAEKLCERLRQCIEDKTFCFDDYMIKVTISIGVSSSSKFSNNSISNFIKRVDALLYDAKMSGKNKVVAQEFLL